jgi:hypothetical protein
MTTFSENWQNSPRRPPQKGLGRFRYETPESEVRAASLSARRWWWEYLRLSKDYWLVCQTSSNRNSARTISEPLARIYQNFGNIYETTFEDWWRSTGGKLFQEQYGPPRVIEIDQDFSNLRQTKFGTVLIQVPLDLSRITVQRQISRILKQYEDRKPRSKLEISTSDFPIHPSKYRIHTLQTMHKAYCIHRELIEKPAAMLKLAQSPAERKLRKKEYEQRADLFTLGVHLGITVAAEKLRGDERQRAAQKNRVRASVSRYLRRAQMLISNVEYGRFPVFSSPTQFIERFTEHQKKRHLDLESEWWSLDLRSELNIDKTIAF